MVDVPGLVLTVSDTTVAEQIPSDLQARTQTSTNPTPPLYVVVVLRKLHHKQPVPPPSSSQFLPAPCCSSVRLETTQARTAADIDVNGPADWCRA